MQHVITKNKKKKKKNLGEIKREERHPTPKTDYKKIIPCAPKEQLPLVKRSETGDCKSGESVAVTKSAGSKGGNSLGKRSGAPPVNENTRTNKRRGKRKRKKAASVEAGKKLKGLITDGLVFSYTTYGKGNLCKLHHDMEFEMLEEFLTDNTVSGGSLTFTLKDLALIDQGRILCCWSSAHGDTERRIFDIRVVGYFEPMKAIVFNLTVIFKHARSQ